MGTFTCIECNRQFESKHKTSICPECKAKPLVCVICGKEFPKKYWPYNQNTCSAKCRGIYCKQSGIAQARSTKMKQTKLDKYGTLDPTVVSIANSGSLSKRICPLCGKEFSPDSVRQIYCKDKHYGPCPVCGKEVEIKDYNIGPQACSEECRMVRINATCLERYGNKDAVNSEHARQLAKQHCLERYGVESYSQTEAFKEKYKATNLERYGVESPLQNSDILEKVKQTNLERYGVEWTSQVPQVKDKVKQVMQSKYGGCGHDSPVLNEKIKATNLERYGVEFPLQNEEVQNKAKQTLINKYGTPYPSGDEVAEKRIKTNLERYGVTNPLGNPEIQAKIKAHWTQKYGGPNPMYDLELAQITSQRQQQAMINKYGVNCSVQVPEIKDKIIATNIEKYGVPWYWFIASSKSGSISNHNRKVSEWLNKVNVENQFEYVIEDKSYDLILPQTNTLVEVDPTVTHNSVTNPWNPDKGLDPNYHLAKTELAEKHNFRCIHIFDWDDSLSIISILKLKQRIYARNCNLMKIDQRTADIFTAHYHLQGKCKGQTIVYGLYYKGELIQLMSFGRPRYNKHYDLELLRLCTKHGVEVVGGASKLFAQFKRDYPISSVLSYCDRSKFTGAVYLQMGMKLSNITPPTKVWSRGSNYVTDNYLRQRGYDQLFGTNYGKGTSNEQLMLDNGWLPVYDCGQKVFEYIPSLN